VIRRMAGVIVAVLAMTLAGCANIPDQSTAQVVGTVAAQPVGELPAITARDPYTLVRDFVGVSANSDAAKAYLTETAKPNWNGEAPPTIIADTFSTSPLPITPQERKALGNEGDDNDETVVLAVNNVGRLGTDGAFVPAVGSAEFKVLVHRDNADSPWRIQTPPDLRLIPLQQFRDAYQRINVYYWDPDFRTSVPDMRYIAAHPDLGAPDRVLRLLLAGPSASLDNAVRTAFPQEATMLSNAVYESDGALVVNLTKLGDRSLAERTLIVTQVVLSLKDVVQTKIRVLADGHPLIGDKPDWGTTDVQSFSPNTRPYAELTGLFSAEGKVRQLRDGQPIAGPAGTGELHVQSAAQSVDGKNLALITEQQNGPRLRVGGMAGPFREVDLAASTLTRPTWLIPGPAGTSDEIWTVRNGVEVVRAVRGANDTWTPSPVITGVELGNLGTITDLRLSRDGVRIAAVIGGKLVVASVVRTKDSVAIRSPRDIRAGDLTNAVAVDWLNQDMLVVATAQPSQPVINVPVDGFDPALYNIANLNAALTAIAAAPDRSVLVADNRGIWESTETRKIWQLRTQVPGARPFYPG
jgi:hypothetical protein